MPSTDTAPAKGLCDGCGVLLKGGGRRCPSCEAALARRPLADAALLTALAAGFALLVTAATFTLTDVSVQPLSPKAPVRDALVTAWRQR
ncbi:hypothetical protein [Azospirillum sp. B4]|uniref:hypothetical protein n=1 Tax=Azospirillum sp. B4 TaxID=95605 RepID=UPI000344C11B|nr:hypothetical protein [Azospirillum sp. B4]